MASLSLPFHGRWFVMQGGDTLNVNHHMAFEPQWYALDFAKVSGPTGRELARESANSCADFYGWEVDVLAPLDGTVVGVEDQWPDNAIGQKDLNHPVGNHVVLTQGDRFYWLAHLQRSSVSVRPGDTVVRGQVLGRCGNSGNSDFPHIHLHATTSVTSEKERGLNMVFGPIDVELTGQQFVRVDWALIRGLFVSNHLAARGLTER